VHQRPGHPRNGHQCCHDYSHALWPNLKHTDSTNSQPATARPTSRAPLMQRRKLLTLRPEHRMICLRHICLHTAGPSPTKQLTVAPCRARRCKPRRPNHHPPILTQAATARAAKAPPRKAKTPEISHSRPLERKQKQWGIANTERDAVRRNLTREKTQPTSSNTHLLRRGELPTLCGINTFPEGALHEDCHRVGLMTQAVHWAFHLIGGTTYRSRHSVRSAGPFAKFRRSIHLTNYEMG